jgi:hypothetical protein
VPILTTRPAGRLLSMGKKKEKKAERLRGQLMLQISAGRYFRAGVPINEHAHRRTVYTNVWFPEPTPVDLPVGQITGSTALASGFHVAGVEYGA